VGGVLQSMRQNNKIIHYFLEGDLGYDYRDSWRKHAPDYELVEWNSKNIPWVECLQPYIEAKRWSIVSDYVRRWVVAEFGGIYLDFDIELIKSPDTVLQYEAFICIEGKPIYANAAVTGGFKGNSFHQNMLDQFVEAIKNPPKYTKLETYVGPGIATEYVKWVKRGELGDRDLKDVVKYDHFVTLPKDYFFPFNWNEEFGGITDRTIGIHHWKKSWG